MADDFALFESPRLLLDGAHRDLRELNAQVARFVPTCTFRSHEHHDPTTGENVFTLRFSARLPPQLRLLASSIVNGLRHSLDQAVCDAAVQLGARATDLNRTYFPFAKDPAQFPNVVRQHCGRVHPDLVKRIELLKPYLGGDDLLWALSSMAGKNKHQRIIHLGIANKVTGLQIHSAAGPARIRTNGWNEARNALELARVGPGGDVDLSIGTTADVVMGDVPVVGGRPASKVLEELLFKCEAIVADIKKEAERLAATVRP